MGCQIRVTRDDTGQTLSNHDLAQLLQSIGGVSAVEILSEPAEGQFVLTGAGGRDYRYDSERGYVAIETVEVAVAESVRKAGREFDKLMFASNNQADVDAYVNRQAERMGHTEIHRG